MFYVFELPNRTTFSWSFVVIIFFYNLPVRDEMFQYGFSFVLQLLYPVSPKNVHLFIF